MELDADLALEQRRHAIVGARDEHEQHGQRVGRLQELGDEIERRLVGPLEALDDEDERLIERDRGDEMPDAADEHLLAVVRVLVLARGLRPMTGLLVRGDLGEARDHRVRHVGLRGAAARARDEVSDLVVRLVAARADRVANELGERAVGHLHAHGRALCTYQARVRRQLGEEGREERRLADAELTDDGAARDDAAAHSVHGAVVGAVELGLLGVASDEVVLRVRLLGGLLLARERALERVDAHRRRQVLHALGHSDVGLRSRVGASPQRKSRRTSRYTPPATKVPFAGVARARTSARYVTGS